MAFYYLEEGMKMELPFGSSPVLPLVAVPHFLCATTIIEGLGSALEPSGYTVVFYLILKAPGWAGD